MKMPKPIGWLHQQGNYSDPSDRPLFDDEKDRGWTEAPLFTEAQLREALASHEAVMRMALEALTSDEHCNCIPTPLTDKAIAALEEQLK